MAAQSAAVFTWDKFVQTKSSSRDARQNMCKWPSMNNTLSLSSPAFLGKSAGMRITILARWYGSLWNSALACVPLKKKSDMGGSMAEWRELHHMGLMPWAVWLLSGASLPLYYPLSARLSCTLGSIKIKKKRPQKIMKKKKKIEAVHIYSQICISKVWSLSSVMGLFFFFGNPALTSFWLCSSSPSLSLPPHIQLLLRTRRT